MSLLHILILALIQGITEFLPISSSAHLILFPQLTGLQDQGVALDVSVHVGTLLAVMVYFRADVMAVLRGLPDLARGRLDTPGARMASLLIIATIPVMALGLILKAAGLMEAMRSMAVIGWTMLGFGIVLYVADKRGGETAGRAEGWTLRDAVILGLWQAIALIPGTSRSGATITGARFLGFERHDAARLSMLMSIPTIIASGGLTALRSDRNREHAGRHRRRDRRHDFLCRGAGRAQGDDAVSGRRQLYALRHLSRGAGRRAAGNRLFLSAQTLGQFLDRLVLTGRTEPPQIGRQDQIHRRRSDAQRLEPLGAFTHHIVVPQRANLVLRQHGVGEQPRRQKLRHAQHPRGQAGHPSRHVQNQAVAADFTQHHHHQVVKAGDIRAAQLVEYPQAHHPPRPWRQQRRHHQHGPAGTACRHR